MEQLLVRMNEQVHRIFEHTGVVALRRTDRRDEQPIGSCVLLHNRGCHWAVTAGHVAAKTACGPWGIVVGGLGNAARTVPIHSAFTVLSANVDEGEFEPDLAAVKLYPHEVNGLNRAPRTRFYSGERAHRDYGPDANRGGTWGAHIMAGFHGDWTARTDAAGTPTPLVMVSYPLERMGDRLTLMGRFIDFRVADAEDSDQVMEWINDDQPARESPRAGELDNLQGMSGSGVWYMGKTVNRDGECPLHLTGIAFLQRSIPAAPVRRHVTVLGCETLNEMLATLAG